MRAGGNLQALPEAQGGKKKQEGPFCVQSCGRFSFVGGCGTTLCIEGCKVKGSEVAIVEGG